jgi:4-amino-4-deoxy-L-arabinose transferase-like glycosyltransferase
MKRYCSNNGLIAAGSILLMVCLYTVALNTFPVMHRDEGMMGYLAELILNGARPISGFFNTYTAPIHSYVIAPFFGLFGKSLVALRIPGILCNIFAISIVTYWFYRKTNQRYVWLLALAFATLPSVLIGSRIATENFAFHPLFTILAVFFAIRMKRQPLGVTLSGFVCGLGIWNHVIFLTAVLSLVIVWLIFQSGDTRSKFHTLLWFSLGGAIAQIPRLIGVFYFDFPLIPSATSPGDTPPYIALFTSLEPWRISVVNFLGSITAHTSLRRMTGYYPLWITILPFTVPLVCAAAFRARLVGDKWIKILFLFIGLNVFFIQLITPLGVIGFRVWIVPVWAVGGLVIRSAILCGPRFATGVSTLIIGTNITALIFSGFAPVKNESQIAASRISVLNRFDNTIDYIGMSKLVQNISGETGNIYFMDGINALALYYLMPSNKRELIKHNIGPNRPYALTKTYRSLLNKMDDSEPLPPIGSYLVRYKLPERILPESFTIANARHVKIDPGLSTNRFAVFKVMDITK